MVFANSFNVARRLSARNEPDLVQESMLDSSKLNYKDCQALASKVASVQDLPIECHVHKDVLSSVENRPSKSDDSIAFQGMGSSAAAALSAREKGHQNYAQIQRRFTNTRRFTKER